MSKISEIWGFLSSGKKWLENTTEAAIIESLDLVLRSKATELALDAVILGNNTAAVYKNNHGGYVASFMDAIIGSDVGQALVNNQAFALINKAMVEPNIAGIPISSSKIETNKDVEISEQMVIVQSQATKKYWTDNAVPRLKEWTINGYLTSFTPLDTGLIIKPSLAWQVYFLNVCADSRRPVIFKTNRNEFVKVQIENLHTVEEATYNNAIEVSLTLKEYNPMFVEEDTGGIQIASFQGSRS
jgi:hypothetical protein